MCLSVSKVTNQKFEEAKFVNTIFKELKHRKGFWNKTDCIVDLIFFQNAAVTWVIIAAIVFALGILHFEISVKECMIYPEEEYKEIEEFARANVLRTGGVHEAIEIESIPDGIEWTAVVEENRIIVTYQKTLDKGFVPDIAVMVIQSGDNFENIEITRNLESFNFFAGDKIIFLLVFEVIMVLMIYIVVATVGIIANILAFGEFEKNHRKLIEARSKE